MKSCTLCNQVKSLDEFYKSITKDGRANQCIVCVKARARIRHTQKQDEIRSYDRQRSKLPHRVLQRVRRTQQEREQSPERYRARTAVNNAVRDGRLLKMDCAFCGASKTAAHHHDYTRPLDVTWLCNPCHARFHALEAMSKGEA